MIVGIQSGLLFHSLTHTAEGGGHGASHDTKVAAANEESGDHAHSSADQDKGDQHATNSDMNSVASADNQHAGHDDHGPTPRHANVFFSIYYFMTGLHAFHIIAGMIAISWLIVRAFNNEFHSEYFGPVDYVGLYWHLVDLIWIYLFPMLYLIK
jgi:cytochrome c oxidase subunit 3